MGTGRVLIPLLQAGHDVEGFDGSDWMLGNLPQELPGARTVATSQPNAMECIPVRPQVCRDRHDCGHILMLIGEFETACAVLRRFHDHLAPGGRLIFDISPDDCFTSDLSLRTWKTPDGDLLDAAGEQDPSWTT